MSVIRLLNLELIRYPTYTVNAFKHSVKVFNFGIMLSFYCMWAYEERSLNVIGERETYKFSFVERLELLVLHSQR